MTVAKSQHEDQIGAVFVQDREGRRKGSTQRSFTHMSLCMCIRVSVNVLFVISLVSIFVSPAYAFAPTPSNSTSNPVGVYVTWYGYNDNSGQTETQHSSNEIAYPQMDQYNTLHNVATFDLGTYDHPITFAAPSNAISSGLFPVGSEIYIPLFQKYFIMEDLCADTNPKGCQMGAPYHADLWLGPQQPVSGAIAIDLTNCEISMTPTAKVNAIVNPPNTLMVDTSSIFDPTTGSCNGLLHLHPTACCVYPVAFMNGDHRSH